MMRHFDMKCYPRERGKKFIHYFGEAIIRGGATIQGNTVLNIISIVRIPVASLSVLAIIRGF